MKIIQYSIHSVYNNEVNESRYHFDFSGLTANINYVFSEREEAYKKFKDKEYDYIVKEEIECK